MDNTKLIEMARTWILRCRDPYALIDALADALEAAEAELTRRDEVLAGSAHDPECECGQATGVEHDKVAHKALAREYDEYRKDRRKDLAALRSRAETAEQAIANALTVLDGIDVESYEHGSRSLHEVRDALAAAPVSLEADGERSAS